MRFLISFLFLSVVFLPPVNAQTTDDILLANEYYYSGDLEKARDLGYAPAGAVYKKRCQDKDYSNYSFNPEEYGIETEEEAEAFLEKCKEAAFSIEDLEKKPAKKSPAPPFTTSTLQQEASRKLGFSVSQTMRIAQNLYESGKISYMRTDSLNLSEEALGASAAEIKTLAPTL